MKIAILHICTGKYEIFWKDFFVSCEEHFIIEAEKEYFVFTDSPHIEYEDAEKIGRRIHRIPQANLGWPDNTLLRYEMFLKIKDQLVAKDQTSKFDYVFFFNANAVFKNDISAKEFLPNNDTSQAGHSDQGSQGGQEKLVGCLHPGYYNKPVKKFTYEKNPMSKAFLAEKDRHFYFAGGINGGDTRTFIEVAEELATDIREDHKSGLTAIWHDESHWNRYLNENINIVKKISPAYMFPEGSSFPFEPKIVIMDKNRLGGHGKMRNRPELRLLVNKLKESLKSLMQIRS